MVIKGLNAIERLEGLPPSGQRHAAGNYVISVMADQCKPAKLFYYTRDQNISRLCLERRCDD